MPRDLFGDVTRPSISIGSRKWYTLPISLLSHALTIAALAAVSLLTPVLPTVLADQDLSAMLISMPRIPDAPKPRPRPRADPVANPNAAPLLAPDRIAPESRGDQSGQDAPVPGFIGGVEATEIELVAPPQIEPPPSVPVRAGVDVRQPKKIHDVRPVYPPLALTARVEGMVIIEATIDVDGGVTSARILRSHPLLDEAALDAVRQWRFTPTLLNGVPVPVILTVTVAFQLSR